MEGITRLVIFLGIQQNNVTNQNTCAGYLWWHDLSVDIFLIIDTKGSAQFVCPVLNFEEWKHHRQGRAKFVGSVGRKLLLYKKCIVQPVKHFIKGFRKTNDFSGITFRKNFQKKVLRGIWSLLYPQYYPYRIWQTCWWCNWGKGRRWWPITQWSVWVSIEARVFSSFFTPPYQVSLTNSICDWVISQSGFQFLSQCGNMYTDGIAEGINTPIPHMMQDQIFQ